MESFFSEVFGPASLRQITISRQGGQPTDLWEFEGGKYTSAPVERLLRRIRLLTFENFYGNQGSTKHLTYAVVSEELKGTIKQLEASYF